MSKPYKHALSSAKKFGGTWEKYMPIHEFLDASKGQIADSRHRALTHNAFFISFVLPKVFGETMLNSEGEVVSVRDVGEQHVLEDFHGRFIPSVQDFLNELPISQWMIDGRGELPLSYKMLDKFSKEQNKKRKPLKLENID